MTRVLDPQDEMFANPYWHALRTEQANIAVTTNNGGGGGEPLAVRFPADVIPFAAMGSADGDGMEVLCELLVPGEAIFVTGDDLQPSERLEIDGNLPGLQMIFDGVVPQEEEHAGFGIVELYGRHAEEMVHLTDVAFPGFFRPRTYTLGRYFGVKIDGELVAMAGERLALPGWREVSAVCTHPLHRGRGYAPALIQHLLRVHAALGRRSFLHLAQANVGALALYERLGFVKARALMFHRVRRTSN